MYIRYLEKLIEYLKSVHVYDQDGAVINNYNEAMCKITDVFLHAKKTRKHVFFIGNGGSAAIASHMTADFMKNGGINTCSVYDYSSITCIGNDYGYENIFSYPLKALGEEGDLLVAISSSGNSENIVRAIHTANHSGMKIITFSGFLKENRIHNLGIYNVHVPVCHYGMVESIHNLILQQLVDSIMEVKEQCRLDD